MNVQRVLALSIALLPWLGGASNAASASQPILPDGTFGAKVGVGIECVPYGKSLVSPPASYAVSDLGRPGVPVLGRSNLDLIHRIQKYVKSPHLRFTWVIPHWFIVYDAPAGVCVDTAPGYPVLNRPCNTFYEPGENPTGTNGLPEDCTPAMELKLRPWLKGV